MALIDAIPVNRVTQPESSVDTTAKRTRAYKEWSQRAKMSLNLSDQTVYKIARQKLADTLDSKIAYNRLGVYNAKTTVGSIFSAKA